MDWCENQMHNMYDFDDVEWWHGMRGVCVMMWTDAGIKCITCLILMMWHGDMALGGGVTWHKCHMCQVYCSIWKLKGKLVSGTCVC